MAGLCGLNYLLLWAGIVGLTHCKYQLQLECERNWKWCSVKSSHSLLGDKNLFMMQNLTSSSNKGSLSLNSEFECFISGSVWVVAKWGRWSLCLRYRESFSLLGSSLFFFFLFFSNFFFCFVLKTEKHQLTKCDRIKEKLRADMTSDTVLRLWVMPPLQLLNTS